MEELFVNNVFRLGLALPVALEDVPVEGNLFQCVPMRPLASVILKDFPHKLLAGHNIDQQAEFFSAMSRFWRAYKFFHESHPVYVDWADSLHLCVPTKIHADEGTGQRKQPVFQCSWGPAIRSNAASVDHYFLWACLPGLAYKHANKGNESGNAEPYLKAAHFAVVLLQRVLPLVEL